MFPQWGMPMLAKTLAHLRYDMRNILNGGFSFEVRAPIPADRPLHLTSRLEEVDDDGRRAILTQLLVTGTEECREALLTRVTAILPLKAAGKGERKEKPLVPQDACEIAMLRFPRGAGLDFGILSGDLNPVHWIRAYARMAGFKSTIMHGFSVAARAIESLNREVFSGRTARIKNFECRFVRPLPYPSSAGVFVDWKGLVFVGDAPGGPAYLTGSYSKTTEGR
jgi:hypothetical protein